MEIEDSDFPLVHDVVVTDNVEEAFQDVDIAIMLSSFPRKQGMDKKSLMKKNVTVFKSIGEAIERSASKDIKVLVVGNPANTNALVCSHFAYKVPRKNFTALTRLDQNRAEAQIAEKLKCNIADVKNVVVWGNHASTQFPDATYATVKDKPVPDAIQDANWLKNEFLDIIQKRGTEIIGARKASAALSAARSVIMHMKSWIDGTKPGEMISMGILSDGNRYDVANGLIYSFPVKCQNGEYTIINNLDRTPYTQEKMKVSEAELLEERELAFSFIQAGSEDNTRSVSSYGQKTRSVSSYGQRN